MKWQLKVMTSVDSPLPTSAVTLVVSRSISNLGSALTSFGLNVWVFQTTGSYSVFAYLALLAALPSLLFAPFAGVIADRSNKKSLLLACDLVSMLIVLIVLAFHYYGALQLSAVATAMLVLALCSELRWSTLGATISIIVPKPHLGRINGLQQSFRGTISILGPVLGAVGLNALGLNLLLALDALSFAIGVGGSLAIARDLMRQQGGTAPAYESFWHEVTYGFRWVFAHPPLRRLLVFFMALNIGVSVFTVTLAPYILSFASNKALGVTLGLQGAGAFLSGLFLARRRKQGDHETRIIWGAVCFGLCMVAWGFSREFAALWCIAFLFGVITTVIMVSSQTIWQTEVPTQIQGKVFAVRTVLSFGLAPLSIFLSVPLALAYFAPLLDASAVLTAIWGARLSGALGLMVSTLGGGVIACALLLLAMGGLRLAERQASPSTI